MWRRSELDGAQICLPSRYLPGPAMGSCLPWLCWPEVQSWGLQRSLAHTLGLGVTTVATPRALATQSSVIPISSCAKQG